ncbi:unnamed protein product [Symbiodinium necroappetens]|uniref:Uncharacterized protein n=1 Tax=Symbiodinium necroappetens TaxID=1628268 RepID=A0A812QIH5_9DINO|nr:unnamed protein product [Symbiodinium necroappetens]
MAAAVLSVLPALWKLPAKGVVRPAWTLQAGRTWTARTVSKQSVVTPRTMVSLPTKLAASAVVDSGPPRPSPIMLRRQCFMQPRSLVSQFHGLPSTTPSMRTASSWSTAWLSMAPRAVYRSLRRLARWAAASSRLSAFLAPSSPIRQALCRPPRR